MSDIVIPMTERNIETIPPTTTTTTRTPVIVGWAPFITANINDSINKTQTNTWLDTILLVIIYATLIAMVYFGSIHFYDCPVCNFIPIYSAFGGALGLVSLSFCWPRKSGKIKNDTNSVKNGLECLYYFTCLWFLIGSIWVYKTFQPNYDDPSSPEFCDKTTYLISFCFITSILVLFGITFTVLCICT